MISLTGLCKAQILLTEKELFMVHLTFQAWKYLAKMDVDLIESYSGSLLQLQKSETKDNEVEIEKETMAVFIICWSFLVL